MMNGLLGLGFLGSIRNSSFVIRNFKNLSDHVGSGSDGDQFFLIVPHFHAGNRDSISRAQRRGRG